VLSVSEAARRVLSRVEVDQQQYVLGCRYVAPTPSYSDPQHG